MTLNPAGLVVRRGGGLGSILAGPVDVQSSNTGGLWTGVLGVVGFCPWAFIVGLGWAFALEGAACDFVLLLLSEEVLVIELELELEHAVVLGLADFWRLADFGEPLDVTLDLVVTLS